LFRRFIRRSIVGVSARLFIPPFMTVVATALSGLSQEIQLLQQAMDALCTRVDQLASMTSAVVAPDLAAASSDVSQRIEHEVVSLVNVKNMVDGLSVRLDKLEATFAAVYGSRPVVVAGGCGLCHNFSVNRLRRTPQYDLYWASSSGCAACVEALLAEVENVNAVSTSYRWTALDFMLWGQNEQRAGRAKGVGHDFDGVRALLLKAGAQRSLCG